MRIGELATATGITTKTLRFYEEGGLLPQAERAAKGTASTGRRPCHGWTSSAAAGPPA
jgi:DNA-binding transcriptional MerR regulator